MIDYTVRALEPDEHRTAFDLVRRALHGVPISDEDWKHRAEGRGYLIGAFAGGELVGATSEYAARLAVPGGALLPQVAVVGVGVRADHTRRGVLTSLMRAQLTEAAGRGDAVAALHASETGIYGRFGYGIGTRAHAVKVLGGARMRPEVPASGEVRLIGAEQAVEWLPELYQRIAPHRPGMMTRPREWWLDKTIRLLRTDPSYLVVVHSGADGDDGFALYRAVSSGDLRASLQVDDMHADSLGALAGLWRYLLGVDLVSEIQAWARPTDDPVHALLVDPRAYRTRAAEDETWHRLLDVPRALRERSYPDASPVVLDVVDPLLENNSGRYLVGPSGVEPTGASAQLRIGVDVLSMIYFGTYRPSTLAEFGQIEVLDPAAPARADRLFGTETAAWCGTAY